jgi:excisionase family DNA binding protein
MEDKKFFSLKKVAEILDVHYATIYREVKRGKISAIKVGNKDYKISETELENYIARSRVQ